jgi:hypothetical protein
MSNSSKGLSFDLSGTTGDDQEADLKSAIDKVFNELKIYDIEGE